MADSLVLLFLCVQACVSLRVCMCVCVCMCLLYFGVTYVDVRSMAFVLLCIAGLVATRPSLHVACCKNSVRRDFQLLFVISNLVQVIYDRPSLTHTHLSYTHSLTDTHMYT
jgi:hypothetical protein